VSKSPIWMTTLLMSFSRKNRSQPELLKAGIRRKPSQTIRPGDRRLALRNIGVQYLVDAVVDYLPSPLDIPPAKGMEPDTHEPMEAPTDDNGNFCSLAFKLWSDPFVGKSFSSVFTPARSARRYGLQSTHEQARTHFALDSDSSGKTRGHRDLLLW